MFNDRRKTMKVVPAGSSSMKHGEKYNAFGMTDKTLNAIDNVWKIERSTDKPRSTVKINSNKGAK
jgi:hypothetical protein